MMLAIFLVSLLAISAVSAADNATSDVVSVEKTTDEVVSVEENQVIEQEDNDDAIGAKDDGTFTALQNKINNAPKGSTIVLENDYIYDEGFDTTGIHLNKDLTIDGNGHTINALSKSRIFVTDKVSTQKSVFKLNNVKICNGINSAIYSIGHYYSSSRYGLTQYNYWNVIIDNCDFINNNGAILGDYLTITNSRFTSNSGGAVRTAGSSYFTSTIANCIFKDNSAESGGAIHINLHSNTCKISKCDFINNRADNGGAIYSQAKLSIDSSTFTSNNAKRGGSVYSGGTDVYVKNSKFSNNRASGDGGAISYILDSSTDVLIQGSTFENNVADGKGGAIYSYDWHDVKNHDKNIITKCTFINNKGSSDKGVVGITTSDCVFKTSSGNSKTVKKATPKLIAKAKSFKKSVKTKKYTVTLKTNQNKVMKNTKLTLKVNGKTYKATTNTKGQATFKITKLTKKGKFTAVVKFAGNKYYNAKTVKPKITVK